MRVYKLNIYSVVSLEQNNIRIMDEIVSTMVEMFNSTRKDNETNLTIIQKEWQNRDIVSFLLKID